MKKVILTSAAAAVLMLSGAASAQQVEQEATSFISEQIANVSVELFNATKATVIETLTVWGDELLASESDQAVAAKEPTEAQQNQAKIQ